jgi:hypothetical protein
MSLKKNGASAPEDLQSRPGPADDFDTCLVVDFGEDLLALRI